jgi:flagellar protein FlgJ
MSADARITNYTDFNGLAALRRDAKVQDPAALREAARQFESVFTRMLLKSMREASSGDELFDSQESQFYRDMFDDQLAVELSNGRGLGLADMMVAQLMRSGLVPPPTEAGAARADAQAAVTSAAAPITAPRAVRDPQPLAVPPTSVVPSARPMVPVEPPTSAVPSASPSTSASPSASRAAGRAPTRQEFIDAILPAAQLAAERLGVSPRNLIAQAALETGWGRSLPRDADGRPSFNFFGIKATGGWRGASVASETTEVLQGREQRMVERFRAYASIEESVADHARLLGSSRRYAAVRGTGDDAQAFGSALQRGGYATDPGYTRKIVAVAESVGRLLTVRRAAAPAPDAAGTGTGTGPGAPPTLKVPVNAPMTVSNHRHGPDRT